MSEPEHFLSRWSRRKREAVQETEQETQPGTQEITGTADKAREIERVPESERRVAQGKPPAAAAESAELPFDLKDLPPIESITAATDLRPFLAPGVPAELARAALRRAWVADPAIRNFVGLAEYAWDYHAPDSMAGFGPLEMTEELRQVVARIIGPAPDENGPESGGSRPAVAQASPDDPKPSHELDLAGSGSPVPPTEAIDVEGGRPQDSPVKSQDVAAELQEPLPMRENTAVHQQAVRRESVQPMGRRGHGRALPK